jgi:diguanylate cyclase (GGDEF)-like protein
MPPSSNTLLDTADWVPPSWAIAGLEFDAERVCRFATERARVLFRGANPVGHSASLLFADWSVAPTLESVGEVVVAHHSDGRLFRCEVESRPQGGTALVLTDISQHVSEAARAAHDNLTGLPQRGALKERLAQALAQGAEAGTGVAVHYIDLDRFKAINDTLGHLMGDTLLVKVAERLRSTLEGADIAARLGGDEFVVVQTEVADAADAKRRATRLVDLVGRTYVALGHTLNVGASVGVALAGEHGEDAETLLRHADLALYRAKADGRGTACFYEPAMNTRVQARRMLEADLRVALAMRQLHLNFQPLYNLSSNRVTGFEALLRWHHPERGNVSPGDFIPLAEEIGLIGQIGEWVLRTACREAASWPEELTVAVNVSAHQFKGRRLVQTVLSALAASGLAPNRLELEITEGALLDETNLVLKALNSLREIGVRISMDDFGTGYSSLSYLRKFPFDKIKIDQSFIRGLGLDRECEAILRAVSGLGASLGVRTTAEGVETAEQLAHVRDGGCTEVQGFFTGRPLAADDVRALLRLQEET